MNKPRSVGQIIFLIIATELAIFVAVALAVCAFSR